MDGNGAVDYKNLKKIKIPGTHCLKTIENNRKLKDFKISSKHDSTLEKVSNKKESGSRNLISEVT